MEAGMDTAGTSDTAGRAALQEAEWRRREEELAQFLNARDHLMEKGHQETEEHDMYAGEDASTKMMHLMHSDTLIVVMALIVMIILGLLFRELMIRLTSQKSRKARMRGGLKQMAEHMHSVQRAMSGDLPEQHDSPKLVMRTYSNYGRARPKEEPAGPATADRQEAAGQVGKYPNVRTMSRENLRVQAFSNILAQEGVCLPSSPQVTIEMSEAPMRRIS